MPVTKPYIERLKCSLSWWAAVSAAARRCACLILNFPVHLIKLNDHLDSGSKHCKHFLMRVKAAYLDNLRSEPVSQHCNKGELRRECV